MPTISSNDLELLRASRHKSQFFLSVLKPRTLWTARVNNGSVTKGATSIAFDTGAGSHFAAIEALQEVWIGSTAGAADIGKARIKSITSGDSGVTGTVAIAANSFNWVDNAFLTFKHDYPLKPRYPFIESDGTFKKDKDVAYSGQNEEPGPVAIAGPHRAVFAADIAGKFGPGTSGITLPTSQSYAMADGATISGVTATIYPIISAFGTGTDGDGNLFLTWADGVLGQYWIKVTATDSNGKTQVTYRSLWLHSNNPNNANYPLANFNVTGISGDWNRNGWQGSIKVYGDSSGIPDGTLAVLWQRPFFGNTQKGISFLPPVSVGTSVTVTDNTVMVGYLGRETIERDIQTGINETDFEFVTIEAKTNNKYMFSVSLEAIQNTPDRWYQYASWLNPGRGIHHFLKWHSTALEVTDFIGLNQQTTAIGFVELEDGTLFSMPNSFASTRSIRAKLVSDKSGRVHFVNDVQLLPDRSGLTTVQAIEKADRSGKITIVHAVDKKAPFAYVSGFSWDGSSFTADGIPDAQPHCAVAPGNDPEDDGASPVSFDRQTFTDQNHTRQIAGRVLAATNNPYPEVRINFHGNYLGVLDICFPEFWTLDLLSTDTGRGLVWGGKNLLCRQVNAQINTAGGTIICNAIFEPEADGSDGVIVDCPTFPILGGEELPVPLPEELSGGLITAASVHYLPPQSIVWDERTSADTTDLGADPWWPVTQDSVASADAIIWRTGAGVIQRSIDAGENWDTMTPGDPPDGTFASCSVIRYEGNRFVQDQHVFLAYESGIGSWLLITEDNGETWDWIALGDSGGGEGVSESVYNADATRLASSVNSPRRTVCGLGSTIVVVYEDESELKLRAFSGSWGDVVTITDFMVIDEEPVAVQETEPVLYALSNNTFVVAYSIYRLGDNQGIFVRAGSVSGNTITLGDPVSMPGEFGYTGLALSLAALTSTKFVIAFRGIFEDGLNIRLSIGELDDLSITMTGITLTPLALEVAGDFADLAILDSETVVCGVSTAQAVEGDYEIQVVVADIDGTSITFRDVETIVQDVRPYATLAPLTINTFALVYNNDGLTARVCVVSGDSIIPQTENQIDTVSGYLPVACGMSSNKFAIAYIDETAESLELVTCLVASSSITVDESESRALGDKPADIGFVPFVSIAPVGSAVAVSFADWQDGETEEAYGTLLFYGSAAIVRGLGMSVAESAAYVTAHDGVQLLLYTVAIPDLEIVDTLSLGDASGIEVNTRQLVAWPVALDDLTLFVYGRMNMDGIYHILASGDGGMSFSSVEDSWGSSHCGALLALWDGSLIAVRNLPDESRLYSGDIDGLTMRRILPFAAQVGVRGIAMWEDGTVYVAARAAVSDLIYALPYPYEDAVNITYDHPPDDGINAIEVL